LISSSDLTSSPEAPGICRLQGIADAAALTVVLGACLLLELVIFLA
jgi:hypothetical protein